MPSAPLDTDEDGEVLVTLAVSHDQLGTSGRYVVGDEADLLRRLGRSGRRERASVVGVCR